MAFDGRFEEADGPGEAWAEQEFRRAGKDSGDAGVSAEPRGREEYYEALRVAEGDEPREGNGDGPGADGDGPEADRDKPEADGGPEADGEEPQVDGNESEGQDGDRTDAGGSSGAERSSGDAGSDATDSGDARVESSSAWDSVDAEKRPPLDEIRVSAERKTHILDGDDQGGGGHRPGTGIPDKTEFPPDWDDKKIIAAALDVARRPDHPPVHQSFNGRWLCQGTRDDVLIFVVVLRSGEVWTAWPDENSPGVVRNPPEEVE